MLVLCIIYGVSRTYILNDPRVRVRVRVGNRVRVRVRVGWVDALSRFDGKKQHKNTKNSLEASMN